MESQLSIRIPAGLNERLNNHIPSGIKSEIIRLILESLIKDLDNRGKMVLGEILDERYLITANREGIQVKTR